MKATLEYELPENETEFKWARNGYEYWSALRDLQSLLRSYRKCDMQEPEAMLEALWDEFPHHLVNDID